MRSRPSLARGTQAVGYAGYEPLTGDVVYSAVEDGEREQEVESAERLVAALGRWQRVPSGRIQPAGHPREDVLRPWDASIRVALDRGCALWCDDAALRRLARSAGVATFGTYALYEVLASEVGVGGLPRYVELKMRLLRARIADVPISLSELSEAVEGCGGPDTGLEFFLGRPAIWREDADGALGWYLGRVNTFLAGSNRWHVPGLLLAASYGLGSAVAPPQQQAAIGSVLAETLRTCGRVSQIRRWRLRCWSSADALPARSTPQRAWIPWRTLSGICWKA